MESEAKDKAELSWKRGGEGRPEAGRPEAGRGNGERRGRHVSGWRRRDAWRGEDSGKLDWLHADVEGSMRSEALVGISEGTKGTPERFSWQDRGRGGGDLYLPAEAGLHNNLCVE